MRCRIPSWLALAALLLPLIGCAPQGPQPQRPRPFAQPVQPWTAPAQGRVAPAEHRVGLLLPLSGGNAPLGEAMLNAAQIALFDQGDRGTALLPRDTRGTPAGAAAAAQAAVAEGARALAGPLTLAETAAVARAAGVPVFAFTSDETQAGPGVWVLGITPTQQVRRIMSAAGETGVRRFALVAPQDAFGQRLAAAMQASAAEAGWPAPTVLLLAPRAGEIAGALGPVQAALPDAVLIGFGGASARAIAQALAAGGTPPRLLGTALWAGDAGLAGEPALEGALFPGPDPSGRARFDQQYAEAFGSAAPRLSGVAYDGAALAARAAREGGAPVGAAFLGADGPIRLLEGGGVQRGLAVFALRAGGEPRLVAPAPLPGGAGS